MDKIKGFIFGFAVYLIASIISTYTDINKWIYITCFSICIFIYNKIINIEKV